MNLKFRIVEYNLYKFGYSKKIINLYSMEHSILVHENVHNNSASEYQVRNIGWYLEE